MKRLSLPPRKRTLAGIGLLLALLLAPWDRAMPAPPPDPLSAALVFDGPLTLCGEPVPLERPWVRERLDKEMLVALGNRPQVILWLKRSGRYFPHLEERLGAAGLPDDLKYLAVAESALRLHAGSDKGALGIWQLMPETARNHGLRVDEQIDERRHFELSTQAALDYLEALHGRFGSWSLALAAYNMGPEGLAAEMLEQGVCDYYRLYLPLETQQFVLRILAIRLILQAPQRYGFDLPGKLRYRPQPATSLTVEAPQAIPLRLIARAAGTDFQTIKQLNPQLRGYDLVAGSHRLNLPPGSEPGFERQLADLLQGESRQQQRRIYVVQPGDHLSQIASQFEVPLAALLIWNNIAMEAPIHPGQRLVVRPPQEGGCGATGFGGRP